MSSVTVALALQSTLDIGAARRLQDYGDLDDAGVTGALEHACMQRFGHIDWPARLRRLSQVAMVVARGGEFAISGKDASSSENEAAALAALFKYWPEGHVEVVSWCGHDPVCVGATRPGPESEAEWSRLIGHEPPVDPAMEFRADNAGADDSTTAEARRKAINRYRGWLRWQHVHGQITGADSGRYEAAPANGVPAGAAPA